MREIKFPHKTETTGGTTILVLGPANKDGSLYMVEVVSRSGAFKTHMGSDDIVWPKNAPQN